MDIFALNLVLDNPPPDYMNWRNLVINAHDYMRDSTILKQGDNPEVFYFQELKHPEGETFMLRMVFYEGAEIMAVFASLPAIICLIPIGNKTSA